MAVIWAILWCSLYIPYTKLSLIFSEIVPWLRKALEKRYPPSSLSPLPSHLFPLHEAAAIAAVSFPRFGTRQRKMSSGQDSIVDMWLIWRLCALWVFGWNKLCELAGREIAITVLIVIHQVLTNGCFCINIIHFLNSVSHHEIRVFVYFCLFCFFFVFCFCAVTPQLYTYPLCGTYSS